MSDLLLVGAGLVILLIAGDLLVRGAVNLSLRLGVPALIVSLTIVAFGTSAPELLISIAAVRDNAGGIALGNVVGSNTANVLLVLGVPALLARLHISATDTRKSYVTMVAVSVLFVVLCFFGPLTYVHGLFLLAIITAILADQFRQAKAHRKEKNGANPEDRLESADPGMPGWQIAGFLALGLVGLPLGADLLVDGSVRLARMFGVSEPVIGLTIIAVGTSLPELATTVVAAYRRQADVALGNVIGSNIFNLLAIIGIATLFGNIRVDPVFLRFDLWVMLGVSVILAPFVFTKGRDLSRRWGILFVTTYVLYLGAVIMMGQI